MKKCPECKLKLIQGFYNSQRHYCLNCNVYYVEIGSSLKQLYDYPYKIKIELRGSQDYEFTNKYFYFTNYEECESYFDKLCEKK